MGAIGRICRTLLPLVLAALAASCGMRDATILDPAGPIAAEERELLLRTSAIMLIVVLPVIVLTFVLAWRFRASNTKAPYTPDWSYSGRLDAVVWAIPVLIVAFVGYHAWVYTHALDPYKPLQSSEKTLEVRVIGQDWKWVFLYPEQNIATVNELVFPSGAPLSLKITSDTVMNSFMIPGLGGQIYAMGGMQTQLNLQADEPGTFTGRNTQFSGSGFPDQHFQAIAKKREDFEAWVETVRQSPDTLDADAYARLAKPGLVPEPKHFSSYTTDLFNAVIGKYHAGHSHKHEAMKD